MKKATFGFCLFLAIVAKTLLFLHFFQLEGDKLFEALAARNLVKGKGLTYELVHSDNLSSVVYEPLNRWPPGYSLLAALFYSITGDLTISCLAIDIVFIVLFFIILYRLLNYLDFPGLLINLLILFNGFIITVYLSKPTDLPALVCCLFAVYMFVTFYNDSSQSASRGFVFGVVNFLPLFLRYMYAPSAIVLPALLIWIGIKRKNKRLKTAGIYAASTTIVLSIGLFIFQNTYTGSAAYVTPHDKGFFCSNLLKMYPAVFGSFFNLNFVLSQAQNVTGVAYHLWMQNLSYLNIALVIMLALIFLKHFFKKTFVPTTKWEFFLLATGILSIVLLLLVSYLSLTQNSLPKPPKAETFWSFIADGRYFIFLMTIIPVICIYYTFVNTNSEKSQVKRLLGICIVAAIALETIHTTYFLIRRFEPLSYATPNVLVTKPLADYMKERIRENKLQDIEVVLTGEDETIANWGVLYGGKGLLNSGELNSENLNSAKDTRIFLITRSQYLRFYEPFLSSKAVKNEKSIDGFHIFSYLIKGYE
jgi:hypothetical protein